MSPRDRPSAAAAPNWLSPRRAVRLTGSDAVGPGGVGGFDLTLAGGRLPVGSTTESFEPVWDARHWLDGARTTFTVVRTDPAISWLAGPVLAPPAAATAHGPLTVLVRLRNLGGAPWPVGRTWLATVSGRLDPLRTSAWPRPTRPPAMAANVTRPGVTVVYPGEVGVWRIPLSGPSGSYAEAWRPIGPGGVRFGPILRTTVTVRR